jgi:hypothetical protein
VHRGSAVRRDQPAVDLLASGSTCAFASERVREAQLVLLALLALAAGSP